jgi:AmmeMemoRadiSam system protein A
MLATEHETRLSSAEQEMLLTIAEQSIQFGLQTGQSRDPRVESHVETLRRRQASFVKLMVGEQIHGCAGSAEAHAPLAVDVARNAFAAAFCNAHQTTLRESDLPLVTIEIFVLCPVEQRATPTMQEAIAMVRPGIEGALLHADKCAAAFLPEMWDSYPNPQEFIQQLREKAGLGVDEWPSSTQLSTFTTQRFSRRAHTWHQPRRAK